MTTKVTSRMYGKVIRAKCPYCGNDVAVMVALFGEGSGSLGSGINLANCGDAQDGGCDRDFVVKWEVLATTESAKLSFEDD